jgi:hypothetical protein
MRSKLLVLIGLCLVLAAMAYGQTAVKANIPFAFTAGTKALPAGSYEVYPVPSAAGVVDVRMRSADGKTAVLVPVITRLSGAIHTTPQDSHLVFDKVGENFSLSEVWIPGSDGYVLSTTAKQHEHRVIDVPR